jgi:hypothetical protein
MQAAEDMEGAMNGRTCTRFLVMTTCTQLLAFSANACSQVDRAEWMEQVKLANGKLVVVKRSATRDQKGSPISRRGAIREYEVTFPNSQTKWIGSGAIRPLAIEIAKGTALIATDIHSRELCAKYENPLGSVLMFRWNGGRWLRVPRSEYPQNGRVNLLENPWGRTSAEDAAGSIELKDKGQRPGSNFSQVPLDERIANKANDACQIYKTL